jgi:hypothetical protein
VSDYVQRGDATTTGQTAEQWSYGNWSIVQPIEGLRTSIDALAAVYRGAGVAYAITPLEGPSARLDVQYQGAITPTEDPVTTQWKFTTKGALVPVEEHPTFVNKLGLLIASWEAVDESNVALGLRTLSEYLGGTPTDDLDATKLAEIQDPANGLVPFCRKIMGGTKSYLRPEPMLVVVTTYQPTAAFIPDSATVGTVYTNAELDTALGIPTDVESKIPTGEWLAEEVDLDRQSDGTKVITQTFRYALVWDADLYP